jgi:hypothetical protein
MSVVTRVGRGSTLGADPTEDRDRTGGLGPTGGAGATGGAGHTDKEGTNKISQEKVTVKRQKEENSLFQQKQQPKQRQ